MSRNRPPIFRGVATALITPFSEGKIDYPALGRLIDRQLEGGVDAILTAGTTGESATLTPNELFRLTRFAKEHIGGRVPLLSGCGSNSTSHAVELAKIASAAGADALLAVTPYYNKASDNGILAHFRAIADATETPLILYNVPSRTGYHLNMNHYRALAKHPRIVGVKEASGELGLLEALCEECGNELDVYTGNDHQLTAAMKLGASGVISVISNLLPRETVALHRLCIAGDWEAAGECRRALFERMQAMFWEVNPIPVKYVAAKMGLCKQEYRLPLCPPSEETARKLCKVFDI